MGGRARPRRYVDQRDRAAWAPASRRRAFPRTSENGLRRPACRLSNVERDNGRALHSGSMPEFSDGGGASLPLDMVLKDASSVIEDVVDDGIEVLARGIWTGATTDHEICAGDCHLDSNAMGLTVLVSMVRRLDGYAEVRDAVEKCLELRGSPIDVVCDGRRCLDAAERDLNGGLHVRLLGSTLSRSRAEVAA